MGQPAEDYQIVSFGFEGSLFDLAGEGHHRFIQRHRHSRLFALVAQPARSATPSRFFALSGSPEEWSYEQLYRCAKYLIRISFCMG